MAEKFTYGPLVYNSLNEESDDSGNYWWAGNAPVAYEEEYRTLSYTSRCKTAISVYQETVFYTLTAA
jgi:hypothetical protein